MKFKLYFGISVFNVLLIVLIATYALVIKLGIISAKDIEFIRYIIVGYVIGAPLLWLFLVYSVNCPHCKEKALPFFNERAKGLTSSQSMPIFFRPFSFMVDKEFFANQCNCAACNENIAFKKQSAELFDKDLNG